MKNKFNILAISFLILPSFFLSNFEFRQVHEETTGKVLYDKYSLKNSEIGIKTIETSRNGISLMVVGETDNSDSIYVWGNLEELYLDGSVENSTTPIKIYNTNEGYLLGEDKDVIHHGENTKIEFVSIMSDFVNLVIEYKGVSYLYSWGSNEFGQLGLGVDPSSGGGEGYDFFSTPQKVFSENETLGYQIEFIASQESSSVLIMGDIFDHNEEIVYTYGSGYYGQLGDGDLFSPEVSTEYYSDIQYDYYVTSPKKIYSTEDGYVVNGDSYSSFNSNTGIMGVNTNLILHNNGSENYYIKDFSAGLRNSQMILTNKATNVDYLYSWGVNNEGSTTPFGFKYKVENSYDLEKVSIPFSFYNTKDGFTSPYWQKTTSDGGETWVSGSTTWKYALDVYDNSSVTTSSNTGDIERIRCGVVGNEDKDIPDSNGVSNNSFWIERNDYKNENYISSSNIDEMKNSSGGSTYEITNISSSRTSFFTLRETTTTGEIIDHLYGMGDNDANAIGSDYSINTGDNINLPFEIYNTKDGYVLDFVSNHPNSGYSNDGVVDRPTEMIVSNNENSVEIKSIKNVEATPSLLLEETNNETGKTKEYLYVWGSSSEGKLANGDENSFSTDENSISYNYSVKTPQLLFETNYGQFIKDYDFSNPTHNSLIFNDGAIDHLYTWGRNDYGQLGDGTNDNSSLPLNLNVEPILLDDITFSSSTSLLNINLKVIDSYNIFIPESLVFEINGEYKTSDDYVAIEESNNNYIYKFENLEEGTEYKINNIFIGNSIYEVNKSFSTKSSNNYLWLWILIVILVLILIGLSIIGVVMMNKKNNKYLDLTSKLEEGSL